MPSEPTSATVLWVDADPSLRTTFADAFAGQTLVFAASAYEAIRNLNSRVFDAYVLEYWLPDWGGVQLCRHIRRTDPQAPVIFYTGSAREHDHKRALRAGATAYYVKPVAPHALRVQVNALLEQVAIENLRARIHEERAIQEELTRSAAVLAQQSPPGKLRLRRSNAQPVSRLGRPSSIRAAHARASSAGGRRCSAARIQRVCLQRTE